MFNPPLRRQTVAAAFEVAGTGVHTGAPGRVRVGPAPWGAGVCFVGWGRDARTDLTGAEAVPGGTVLRGDPEVRTPEHLLAALLGMGVTDVRIEVEGPEVPIVDGSARPWCDAIAGVGRRMGPTLAPLRLPAVTVEAAGGWARAAPGDVAEVHVEVGFDDPALPRGTASVTLGGPAFRLEVAWARTFALARDVAVLRAAGRGGGATTDNTLVYGPAGVVPPGRERGPGEAVRHKLLDAIGDLALLGRPFVGRVEVHRGSHALHHALVRALLSAGPPRSRSG